MPGPGEFEDFKTRVNRNDYTQHKVYIVAAIASMVLGVALLNATLHLPVLGIALGAPFLVMSALRAMSGGKSAVSPDGNLALELMSPYQRRQQARYAAHKLLVFALAITAIEVWADYQLIRARIAEHAEKAKGFLERDLSSTPSDADFADGRFCYTDEGGVTCEPLSHDGNALFNMHPVAGKRVAVDGALVHWFDGDSILSGKLDPSGGTRWQSLDASRVGAMRAAGGRVVFVSGTRLMTFRTGAKTASPIFDGLLDPETSRLAVTSRFIVVSATRDCAIARLSWSGRGVKCLAHWKHRACALAARGDRVVATDVDGRLWSLSPGAPRSLGVFPRACAVVATDRFALTVAPDGVYRVPLQGGPAVNLYPLAFKSKVLHAGTDGDRVFWLGGAALFGVRIVPH